MEKEGSKVDNFLLRISIIKEFFGTLWKYKLWWSIPIVLILLFTLMIILFAGHTGVAALIYPLF